MFNWGIYIYSDQNINTSTSPESFLMTKCLFPSQPHTEATTSTDFYHHELLFCIFKNFIWMELLAHFLISLIFLKLFMVLNVAIFLSFYWMYWLFIILLSFHFCLSIDRNLDLVFVYYIAMLIMLLWTF